jgi:TRAP-type mannitol/chloroaromatic compound transport system permease large subunit
VIRFYKSVTALFALTFLALGVALLVVTAARGGGATGYLIGVLFVALGLGRLYLLRARRREIS